MMDSRLRGKNGRSGNDVVAYGEWGRATTRVAPTGGGGRSGMMLEGEGRFANRP